MPEFLNHFLILFEQLSSVFLPKCEVFQEHVEDNTAELSSGTPLSELPLDVLQSISKHLILFDYMNLRVTCKTLHRANPPAQWRANGQYPVLMFFKDFSKTYDQLDPFENVSRTISAMNESSEILSNIESYKDGWFLLSSGWYVEYFNPFKNETIKCPPCAGPLARFDFSTCPTSPDCLTVGIANYSVMIISCFDAAVGGWVNHERELNYDRDIKILRNNKSGGKYHKNAFYFPGTDGSIGELKFVPGEISWKVYGYPFDVETSFESSYLVELEGELVSVFIGENGSWVKVFKFDFVSECWMKLDNLGDHALFVSPPSSFSIKTDGKSEMRNRIYLPRRRENEVVFYSFETGKYHTPRGANSMDDFDGTRAHAFCCWVNSDIEVTKIMEHLYRNV